MNPAPGPCSATPRPGRPFCLWHDPEAGEARRELSRKGGKGRSNAARARKAYPAALTVGEVQGYLAATLKGVMLGRFTPGQGNAVAALARAIVTVREATELEERIEELERAAGTVATGTKGWGT